MVPPFDRPAPRSDPTNPYDQESAGINEATRWTNQRSQGEPGLTERERDERAQAMGWHALSLRRACEQGTPFEDSGRATQNRQAGTSAPVG
jgi:hypothetical protein